MKSISLSVFSFKVKRNRAGEFLLLNQFSDDGDDLLDVLKGILHSLRASEVRSDESSQALQVTKLDFPDRELEGLLQAGSYGTESQIRRLGEWATVRYNKSENDVDLHPFYFLFVLPEAREQGYFVMQSSGKDSVQTLFRKVLHERFVKDHPDFRLHYKALVPEELMDAVDNDDARASEVRFLRHHPPADLARRLEQSATSGTTGTVDLVVRVKEDGFSIRALQRLMRSQPGVIEFDDSRFSYDSVKIKMKIGGKDRTVDLGNEPKFNPTVDVTEQLTFRSGNPTFTSLSAAAHELLGEMRKRLE